MENGAIRAESLSSFGTNNAMTVLVRFDPDLLTPAVEYSKDFEKVQEMAFKGSDYKPKKSFTEILGNIIMGIFGLVGLLFSPVGIFVIVIVLWLFLRISSLLGFKYWKSIYGQSRIKGWYRDVPLEGSIPAAYYALVKGDRLEGFVNHDHSKNLIGAYFLKWVLNGVVGVIPDPDKKNRVNLSFEKESHFDEPVENDLYQMVREASGANLILEAGELEKWSKKSFKRISNLPGRVQTQGHKWFQDKHFILKGDRCNPTGQEQARHLIEFKNFLEDFTLSKERGSVEVTLWRDYLVFAAMFGIADKVAKEFEKLYPAEFSQFAQDTGLYNTSCLLDTLRVSNDISASAMRKAMSEKASHSSGSGWSGGGGGGFSSGGGGGSFGGGFGGGSR